MPVEVPIPVEKTTWHTLCNGVDRINYFVSWTVPPPPAMLASPYHQISSSHTVRGIVLWFLMCFTVFYVLNGLATRPLAIPVESYRKAGMSDEHVLSMALQDAVTERNNFWWINDREAYLVFDSAREYRISPMTYAAFDIHITFDAGQKRIGVFEPEQRKVAGMRP